MSKQFISFYRNYLVKMLTLLFILHVIVFELASRKSDVLKCAKFKMNKTRMPECSSVCRRWKRNLDGTKTLNILRLKTNILRWSCCRAAPKMNRDQRRKPVGRDWKLHQFFSVRTSSVGEKKAPMLGLIDRLRMNQCSFLLMWWEAHPQFQMDLKCPAGEDSCCHHHVCKEMSWKKSEHQTQLFHFTKFSAVCRRKPVQGCRTWGQVKLICLFLSAWVFFYSIW